MPPLPLRKCAEVLFMNPSTPIDRANIAKLKKALHLAWEPRDDGFEFSWQDSTVWMYRTTLINDAEMYRLSGFLPTRLTP
jgi:hypothetical protein